LSFQQVLTTIEHWGGCEKEQPKVGPKGEEVGTRESKDTESTEEREFHQLSFKFQSWRRGFGIADCRKMGSFKFSAGFNHGEHGEHGGKGVSSTKF